MAEFNITRFKYVWRGPHGSGISYNQDDIVSNGGKIYVCLIGHIADPATFDNDLNAVDQYGNPEPRWELMADGQKWRGVWQTTTKYEQNEIVKYGATLYKCNTGHTSADTTLDGLPENASYWDYVATTFDWRDFWVAGRQYEIGDVVSYNGITYICTLGHVASDATLGLENDIINWTIVNRGTQWKGNWEVATRYYKDNVVKYGAKLYRCTVGHTSDASELIGIEGNGSNWELILDGVRYRGAWTANTTYLVGDIARVGSSLQRCITLTNTTEFVQGAWQLYIPGIGYETLYNALTTYQYGDLVMYGGYSYRSVLDNNIGNSPAGSPNWEVVTEGYNWRGQWTSNTEYLSGDTIREGGNIFSAIQDTSSYPFEPIQTITYNVTVQSVNSANKYFINGIQSPSLYLVAGNTYVFDQTNILNSGHAIYLSTTENGHHDGGSYNYYETNVTYRIDGVASTREDYLANFDSAETRSIELVAPNAGTIYLVCVNHSGMYDTSFIKFTSDSSSWTKIVTGNDWKGPWKESTYYTIGDIVGFAGSSYVCIQPHSSDDSSLVSPDLDDGSYWNVFYAGSATNVLNNRGDIKTREGGADIRKPAGSVGSTLVVDNTNIVAWDQLNFSDNVYYVSLKGQDIETAGTEGSPFRTIRYACEYVGADAGRRPATIFVKTGTFSEVLPIVVPSDTAIVGDELRSTVIKPAPTFELSDMFRMHNGTGLRNCTLQGLSGELSEQNAYFTRRPSAGAYVALDPGSGPDDSTTWITSKSPYVQNVTTFGTGCIGMKIDGALHEGGNKSMVANDFTQILSDGIGYWANEEGKSELVSVFTYYCHIGYLATNGGKLRATNGNNSYGDYGSVAEGSNTAESAISAVLDNRTSEAIVEAVIIDEDDRIAGLVYEHAGQEYTNATTTVTGSGVSANLTYTDFRKNAISQVRLLDADDSSSFGGAGFRRIENNAQAGDETTITLAASDENSTNNYVGMVIWIIKGIGAGQWGRIDTYDFSTKIATITNIWGQPGWNTIVEGKELASALDGTTRYSLEPYMDINKPTFNSGSVSTGSFKRIGAAATDGENTVVLTSVQGSVFSYSTDGGTSWTNASVSDSDDWIGCVWVNDKFIAIGAAGNSKTSTDGVNWSNGTIPGTAFSDIKVNGDVVMITNPSADAIYISTDAGTSWTTNSTGLGSGFNFVGTSGDYWMVCDTAGNVYESKDNGNSWAVGNNGSGLPLPANYVVTDFEGGPRSFVAMVRDGTSVNPARTIAAHVSGDQTPIFALQDAIKPNPNNLNETSIATWYVTGEQGLYFAMANTGATVASVDAINWHPLTPTGGADTRNIKLISCTGNHYYIPCNNSSASTITPIEFGTPAIVRCSVRSQSLDQINIVNPGAGYIGIPEAVIYDQNVTVDAVYEFRVQNGVLGQPFLTSGGIEYTRAAVEISGDGYADIYPSSGIIYVKDLLREPGPGDALTFGTLPGSQFSIQKIEDIGGTEPNLTAKIQITPNLDVNSAPQHDTTIEIRQLYSQIRLTGHDFLDIGTGNFTETAYPNRYVFGYTSENTPRQFQETVGSGGGRVFYTSTDQDGNFRVGELFKVDQATGVVTISASQFDLSGLDELVLGGIVLGGTSAVVREFSKDQTFVANSDNIVPTQRAIAGYFEARISSGGAVVNANTLIAGDVQIQSGTIGLLPSGESTSLKVSAPVTAIGGMSGVGLQQNLFTAK